MKKFVFLYLVFSFLSGAYAQTPSISGFAGMSSNGSSPVIPDDNVDVGFHQVGQIVNGDVTFFSKTSPYAQVAGYPMSLQTPWNQNGNNGGATPNCGQAPTPNVMLLHDHVNSRWIIERRAHYQGNDYICIA